MASVRWTSELMTNVVAAVPVANETRFATCLDSQGQGPGVFGMSNHPVPQLLLVKENHDGIRTRQNFGKVLGISETTPVQAFDVRQAADLSIYMVVVTKFSDTQSSILVVKPFQLTDAPFPIIAPVQQLASVYQVYLGAPLASGGYPNVILAHQRMDRISKSSDVVQLDVQVVGEKITWSPSTELQLPLNVDRVLDLSPVYSDTLSQAQGIYALCVIQGQTKLIATYVWGPPGSRRSKNCELICEQGANCIESYVEDADGNSALILGGTKGLWNYPADELLVSKSTGKLVYSDQLFQGATNLAVAQDGTNLSIFANNKDKAISYVLSSVDNFPKATDIGYYLMTQGQSANFSATILHPSGEDDTKETVHSLVSVDSFGNLALVEQSDDTGIWKFDSFYVSNLDETLDVQSYSVSVEALLANGKQATGGSVFLQSSTPTSAIVNGKQTTLVPTGQWIELDQSGELALIMPTSGVIGAVVTISKLRDSDETDSPMQKLIVDPSASIVRKLAGVSDFGTARGVQTNQPLYPNPGDKPPEGDLTGAVTAYGNLASALNDVPADGSLKTSDNLEDVDIGDWFMDGWNWVKDKADKAVNWVVERAGEFWRFVCEIAGETKRFVLNCVEKITEAATWVWEKIKLGWEKLCDLVGFLFNWDDIVATKNTISSFFTAALDLTTEKIVGADKKVDDWISGLQSQLGERKDPNRAAINTKAVNETEGPSAEAQQSTAFKWAFERVKNGGKGSDTLVKAESGSMEPNDQTWKQVFEPLLDSIIQLAREAADDLCEIFHDFDSFTTGALWAKLGADFLYNVLEVIKKIIHAALLSVAKLIQLFKNVITGKTRIPILSKLFETIFGETPSLFNILCFVIAIPATVLTKIIIGKAPPTFPSPINAALLDGILGFSSNPLVTPAVKLDFATLSAGVTTSIAFYKGLYQTIRLAYTYVSGDQGKVIVMLTPGMAMKVITIILDIVGVLHTFPTDNTVPGHNLRLAASILGVVRCVGNVLLIATPLGGSSPEEKNLVLDALSAIVNWGLYQAVYVYELDDKSWKDYDEAVSIAGITANTLDLVAGMGKFIAFIAKEEPPVSAAGVVAMNVANFGMFVTDGVIFHDTNEKERAAMLPTPSI